MHAGNVSRSVAPAAPAASVASAASAASASRPRLVAYACPTSTHARFQGHPDLPTSIPPLTITLTLDAGRPGARHSAQVPIDMNLLSSVSAVSEPLEHDSSPHRAWHRTASHAPHRMHPTHAGSALLNRTHARHRIHAIASTPSHSRHRIHAIAFTPSHPRRHMHATAPGVASIAICISQWP